MHDEGHYSKRRPNKGKSRLTGALVNNEEDYRTDPLTKPTMSQAQSRRNEADQSVGVSYVDDPQKERMRHHRHRHKRRDVRSRRSPALSVSDNTRNAYEDDKGLRSSRHGSRANDSRSRYAPRHRASQAHDTRSSRSRPHYTAAGRSHHRDHARERHRERELDREHDRELGRDRRHKRRSLSFADDRSRVHAFQQRHPQALSRERSVHSARSGQSALSYKTNRSTRTAPSELDSVKRSTSMSGRRSEEPYSAQNRIMPSGDPTLQNEPPTPPAAATAAARVKSDAQTGLAPARRMMLFRALPKIPTLRRDPVKMQRKFDAAQLRKQQKEQAQQRKREAAEKRKQERDKLAQRRKVAALVEQQKRDAEKARRQQAKKDAKQEAQHAKKAKASEAYMLLQRQQRQQELAEMDRKQKRLLAITPFQQRNATLDHHLLTPMQRHVLIRSLVMMQMQHEWLSLGQRGVIALYGYPFTKVQRSHRTSWAVPFSLFARQPQQARADDPLAAAENVTPSNEPLLLRHLFQTHLRTFPGLCSAPVSYWQSRIQRLIDEYVSLGLSTSRERGQHVLSHMLTLVGTQYIGLFFARGIGIRGADELRGPGIGDPGTEEWGVGKGWGSGTVKRGMAKPYVLSEKDHTLIESLYDGTDLRAWKAAGRESARIQHDWAAFKEKIIEQEDGLNEMTSYLTVSNVNNLPMELQNTEEWVRIHMAVIMRWLFVESPSADTIFEIVRVIHNLMPYWTVRQALSVTNAKSMVQLLLSIFLAQPAGTDSLLQRIISSAISRDVSTIQNHVVEPLRKELPNIVLVNKIELYVRDRTAEDAVRMDEDTDATGNDMLTTILLSNWDPFLDMDTQDHVLAMQKAFAASPYRTNLDLAYPSSTPQGRNKPPIPMWDATTVDMSNAREFALLKLLLRALLEKRDRTNLAKWFGSSVFVHFVKDSLQHVFYTGLQEASRSADLSARLADLQKLMEDFIEVRTNTDNGIEHWLGLSNRHHQSIYFFFHEIAPVLGPVWRWCQEALDFMSLSTSDPQHPDDRSAQDIEVNLDEMLQDQRLTEADVQDILREVDDMIVYSRWSKIRRELEYRRLFLLSQQHNQDGHDDSSMSGMSQAMREDMHDIDGLMAELLEKEGVPIDDGTCDDVRGTERRNMPWAYFDVVDPLGQAIMAEPETKYSFKPTRVSPRPPSLFHTRKLLPMFRELLVAELPDWLDPDLNGPPQPHARQLRLSSLHALRQTR